MHSQSRRDFIRKLITGCAAASVLPVLDGCSSITGGSNNPLDAVTLGKGGSARLSARPTAPITAATPGSYAMNPSALNDAVLVVPDSYTPGQSIPLVLALHGAGDLAQSMADLFAPSANARGFAVLAVGSRGITWDAITFKYGVDVTFIDQALRWAFDRVAVDQNRLTIAGFSDGATYTLGLALANGDFFTRAIAFSPGYVAASSSPIAGKPKFFESHGREDQVLPIDGASRRIVPALEHAGYEVTYVEFDGGHQIPKTVLSSAVDFIMA